MRLERHPVFLLILVTVEGPAHRTTRSFLTAPLYFAQLVCSLYHYT